MPERPTPVWEEIVELIGEGAADRLSLERGGGRIYVPHQPGPNAPLTVIVGQAAADLLAGVVGGDYIVPPLNHGKRSEVRYLRSQGWSIPKIAKRLRWTQRAIYRILAENPPEERQYSLGIDDSSPRG